MMTSQVSTRTNESAPLSRRWRSHLLLEAGATLVETALSLSLLMAITFGIIETGWMLFTYHTISNAAREGARYAMVRGSTAGTATCSDPSTTSGPPEAGCKASTQDIQNYVRSFPGLSGVNVNTTWVAPPDGTPCSPCTGAGNVVQVQVTYPFLFNIPFVSPQTVSMSSTSKMLIAE